MQRGDSVIEIATGRKATVVFTNLAGTSDESGPWAHVMFDLGEDGVSFADRLMTELRPASEVLDVGFATVVEIESPATYQCAAVLCCALISRREAVMFEGFMYCDGCAPKKTSDAPSPVYVVMTGQVYHLTAECRAIRGRAISGIPKRDAELYFRRFPCEVCSK